jgi:hypothetical protein
MRPPVAFFTGALLLSAARGQPAPSAPVHRELDFWLGDWTVFDAHGTRVGTNRIDRVLGGAALVENWRDADGSEGKSWFYFSVAENRWKQVWVTDGGFSKEKSLVEHRADGGVRFRGEIALPDGRRILDRTTLTRAADGTVRQVIEQSTDGGQTWKVGFDAVYRRPAVAVAPPASHDFDFWIGDWSVTTPDGKFAGTNHVEPIAAGHGLLENWTGAGGGSGKSINAYNAARGQWQQFWIGAAGGVLELTGGLDAAGRMVLASPAAVGGARHRITWTPNSDGTVRQLWESSSDDSKTWTTAFDGLYRRKGGSDQSTPIASGAPTPTAH